MWLSINYASIKHKINYLKQKFKRPFLALADPNEQSRASHLHGLPGRSSVFLWVPRLVVCLGDLSYFKKQHYPGSRIQCW